MATAAAPKGQLVELALKDESSFGSAATGNYQKTLCYEYDATEKQDNIPDPVLGTARNNDRDTTTPAPDLPSHDGSAVVPMCLNHMWFWLKGAFGTPNSSGSPSDYTHVFTSGSNVLPHRTIEKKAAAAIFFQDTGVLVQKLGGNLQREGGYGKMNVTLTGRKQTKLTSTGAGTPPAILAYDPLIAAVPVFKLDTVAVADVISLSWEYDNKAAPMDYLGDPAGYPLGHDLDEQATFTGQIRLRFRTAAMHDQAKARTPFAMQLLWQRTSVRSLSIDAPIVRLNPVGVPTKGPGRMEQTFQFMAEQSASGAMVSATLKNGSAASAYA